MENGKRASIIRLVAKRRHTLTEIARELGTSLTNAKQHLKKLVDMNMLVQVDEGRKWKYYEIAERHFSNVHKMY